jgi:hypothetical protein
LDKSNHRRVPKFQYCGRNLDAKPSTNGVLAKDSKIGAKKTIILTYRVLWTLRYSMLLAPFSVKMMDPKGMKVYDNFANDFLYPNINNIMVLPKIMIRIASMKSIRMILENTR